MDVIAPITVQSPTTILGTHLGATGTHCHGVVITGDITLDTGGTLSITGQGLANGSDNYGVNHDSGSYVMDDAPNTISVAGSSTCTGANCAGVYFFGSFGDVVCNSGSTPCVYDVVGNANTGGTGSYGVVSSGTRSLGNTDVSFTGTSGLFVGVGVYFQVVQTSGLGSFTVDGTSSSTVQPAVEFGVGGLAWAGGSGDLDIRGTGGSGSYPILVRQGFNPPLKNGGKVTFHDPVRFQDGGATAGPFELEISQGTLIITSSYSFANSVGTTIVGSSAVNAAVSVSGPLSLGTGVLTLSTGSSFVSNAATTLISDVSASIDTLGALSFQTTSHGLYRPFRSWVKSAH